MLNLEETKVVGGSRIPTTRGKLAASIPQFDAKKDRTISIWFQGINPFEKGDKKRPFQQRPFWNSSFGRGPPPNQ
jgi:hypothetical protein